MRTRIVHHATLHVLKDQLHLLAAGVDERPPIGQKRDRRGGKAIPWIDAAIQWSVLKGLV